MKHLPILHAALEQITGQKLSCAIVEAYCDDLLVEAMQNQDLKARAELAFLQATAATLDHS